jgi:hypothetical protein
MNARRGARLEREHLVEHAIHDEASTAQAARDVREVAVGHAARSVNP